MLRPSYADLIHAVNSDWEEGAGREISSRYSIVMAIAKRARQIIDGDRPMIDTEIEKPLSIAVEELSRGKVRILGDR